MTDGFVLPREGELYMKVAIQGYDFELRYGYYEESDREFCEPVVIYPDLIANPHYTPEGHPLVTAIQSPCEHYTVPPGEEREDCCSDCIYYPNSWDEIGICQCEGRRLGAENDNIIKMPPKGGYEYDLQTY